MPKILERDPAWLASATPGHTLFQPSTSAAAQRSPDSKDAGASRKLAHRGTELFVAVGNELRWSEIGLLKDAGDRRRRQHTPQEDHGQMSQARSLESPDGSSVL